MDFYQKLDVTEQLGKDIVMPDSSHEAIYLSECGELFCYTGIHDTGRESDLVKSWPYNLGW